MCRGIAEVLVPVGNLGVVRDAQQARQRWPRDALDGPDYGLSLIAAVTTLADITGSATCMTPAVVSTDVIIQPSAFAASTKKETRSIRTGSPRSAIVQANHHALVITVWRSRPSPSDSDV
jgi:hypothetical protein